jgi:uncharacterized membrane protein
MLGKVGESLRKNLGAGILVFVPLALTLWLAYAAWDWVNAPLVALFRMPPPEAKGVIPAIARFLHGTFGPAVEILARPGVGLLLLILIIYILGMLARTFLGRWFVALTDAVLARLPVIRTIYMALKQILGAILSGGEGRFRQAVLFEYPRKGIYSVGFVTSPSHGEVQERTEKETVNIFLPTTPNPTSGFLLLVPREDLTYLDMSVEDAVKLIISGGMVIPPAGHAEGPVKVSNPEIRRAGDGGTGDGPGEEEAGEAPGK